MRNMLVAISLATLWIVLLTLGLSAQSNLPGLPDFPDLPDRPRQVQFTIPPFEPPTGTLITVTTTADTWDDTSTCSLRQAIQAANTDLPVGSCPAGEGDDLIILPAGVYALTREGSSEDDNISGDLDIRSSLIISGAGAETTFVDANGIDRVLHVHEGSLVELRGLTLRNGQPAVGEPGGGLYNLGTFTLTNSIVANNFAGDSIHYGYPEITGGIAGGAGAGIANEGVMVLVGSTVMENECTADRYNVQYGGGGPGGGIYNHGMLSVIHSLVISNSSGHGAGFQYGGGGGGHGGGIYNSGNLSVLGSVISGNHTGSGGQGIKGHYVDGFGGGIGNIGAVTVTNSQIKTNTGWGAGGGLSNGNLFEQEGTVWLVDSEISDNGSGQFGGGGVYNTGYLIIEKSTIRGNQCWYSGPGGGIRNDGIVYVTYSTISGNRSGKGRDAMYLILPGGNGGGIFNQELLFLNSSTVAANAAGGRFEFEDGNTYCEVYPERCKGGSGGGLANDGGVLSVHNSIVAQNSVGDGGVGADCLGTIISYGYNLVSNTSSCSQTGFTNRDLYDRYAWLAPLANNGGPTLTHALLPQSPALNAGSCTALDGTPITTDQRGEPRPQGAGCDIGAYESDLEYVPPEEMFLPVITKNNE